MADWSAFLLAYLLGGLTFVPLVLLLVVAHAWLVFPRRRTGEVHVPGQPRDHDRPTGDDSSKADIFQPGDDAGPLDSAKKSLSTLAADSRRHATTAAHHLDVAAAYFAVFREYAPPTSNPKPVERSMPPGSASTAVTAPSPSVYQTMYRTIFDRRPAADPLDSNSLSHRPRKAGNVFYLVLRHGHLLLFDDEDQLEVRHVISLAHHKVSIYSGGDATPEGELFIKRNALCLSRVRPSPDHPPDAPAPKPFYLFSENCSAKEDFYFALLRNQEQAYGLDAPTPRPQHFNVENIISLVQRLHSSDDHLHTRWFNAMLGRIFLAVYKTRDLENFIRDKITSKISRVKRPSFLTNITIQRIDTGEAAPFFTSPRLRDLTVEGECLVEADVRYTGNFRIEVGATAKIDLGSRFKAREVNLVLAVVLRRLEGHVLVKVKPPPSNRVWFSFQTKPKMEMTIEPIVSSRQITYTLILRQIENRIKEVFAETLVLPYWDDVPFFRTEHKKWRGGIFEGDEGEGEELSQGRVDSEIASKTPKTAPEHRPDRSHGLENEPPRPLEKSQSLPVLDSPSDKAGLFGRRGGKNENHSSVSILSTGLEVSPSRSPSIVKNSTGPIVGTETTHADLFKPSSSPPDQAANYMTALQSLSQSPPDGLASSVSMAQSAQSSKRGSSAQASSHGSSSSREGGEGEKEDEAEATPAPPRRRGTASSAGSSSQGDSLTSTAKSTTGSGSLRNQAGTLGRGLFLRRENSNATSSTDSSHHGGDLKRNTLAVVTNAAAQARQWGLNALQRQKDGRRNGDRPGHVDLSQPMGRGQPLPPPGTPLPGPANGSRTRVGPLATPKRKPMPVPTPALAEVAASSVRVRQSRTMVSPGRRRGVEAEPEGGEDQSVLIVEAPQDSRPGTPGPEDEEDAEASWGGVVGASEISMEVTEEVTPEPEPSRDESASDGPAVSKSLMRDDGDGDDESNNNGNDDNDDDDDGYAGWIDDDNEGLEGVAAVSVEGRADRAPEGKACE